MIMLVTSSSSNIAQFSLFQDPNHSSQVIQNPHNAYLIKTVPFGSLPMAFLHDYLHVRWNPSGLKTIFRDGWEVWNGTVPTHPKGTLYRFMFVKSWQKGRVPSVPLDIKKASKWTFETEIWTLGSCETSLKDPKRYPKLWIESPKITSRQFWTFGLMKIFGCRPPMKQTLGPQTWTWIWWKRPSLWEKNPFFKT